MRIALMGHTGQVGWEAHRCLATLGEVVPLDDPRIDFTRPAELYRAVMELRPQVIYNAVAYTAVDAAESNADVARLINVTAVGALAEAARKLGAVLVHFSTDYVFDGQKGCGYVESDRPNPLNVYGQTKLEGEQAIQQIDCAHLIFRTAWVYSLRRDSFVTKVLQWAGGRPSIRVVTDQVSNPTWARALAEATAQVLARGGDDLLAYTSAHRGVYHLAGDGYTSRFEWARAILGNARHEGPPVQVLPASSADFPTPASRPLYSTLDCTRFANTFNLRLPPWEQALRLAMQG